MELLQTDDAVASALIQADFDRGKVELWTTRRLSFEPKGALKEARNLLRKQLQRLVAGPGAWLDAMYVSKCTDFVDVENVLLYNVGTAALSSASRSGLRFSRTFSDPPECPRPSFNWRHYHRYAIAPNSFAESIGAPSTARVEFDLPRFSASLKPHDYWWPARVVLTKADVCFEPLRGNFNISAHISGPRFPGNLAASVKPLFDGIISALHWDPEIASTNLACELLAAKLNVLPEEIAALFQTPRNAILGRRKVVATYRDFVKWNPADDHCVVGQLQFTNQALSKWRINVSFSVES